MKRFSQPHLLPEAGIRGVFAFFFFVCVCAFHRVLTVHPPVFCSSLMLLSSGDAAGTAVRCCWMCCCGPYLRRRAPYSGDFTPVVSDPLVSVYVHERFLEHSQRNAVLWWTFSVGLAVGAEGGGEGLNLRAVAPIFC